MMSEITDPFQKKVWLVPQPRIQCRTMLLQQDVQTLPLLVGRSGITLG